MRQNHGPALALELADLADRFGELRAAFQGVSHLPQTRQSAVQLLRVSEL
jgi:hypothetical protein